MLIQDRKGHPILDLPFNIGNNELPDVYEGYKFGKFDALSNTKKTIWTGSTLYVFPESRKNVFFASTNSVDVCTGTIIKAVKFDYLTSSWDKVTVIHCLNGQSPIHVASDFLRLNRAKFLSNCEMHINTGDIWLGTSAFTAGVPVDKYGHIQSGRQQTYQAFYSVPRGECAKIYDLLITVNEGKQVEVEMYVNDHGERFDTYAGFSGTNIGNTYQAKNHYDIFQSGMPQNRKVPLCFNQMTDIEFRGLGTVGGATSVSVEWSMISVTSRYFTNDNR